MADIARRVLPLVGYALGGWPGYLIGTVLGGVLFPPQSDLEPAELAAVKLTGPARGQPLPFGYGRHKCTGKLIWAGPQTIHEPSSSKKGGGKGMSGKGDAQNVRTYSRSFLFALLESLDRSPLKADIGQAWDLFRVWAGDDLVYDVDNPDVQAESGFDFTFYPGTADDDPDPRMADYQSGGLGQTAQTYTETRTLEGAGPTHTITRAPIVPNSDRIWGGGFAGGGTFTLFTRVGSSPGQDQYTIDPNTGLITFGGTYSGLIVQIQYQVGTLTSQQEPLAYPYVCKIYVHEYNTGPSPAPPNLTFEVGPGGPFDIPDLSNVWVTEASWTGGSFGTHYLSVGGETSLARYGTDASDNPMFYMVMARGANLELVKISKTTAPTIVATVAPPAVQWQSPMGCVAVPDGVLFGGGYGTYNDWHFRLYRWDGSALTTYLDSVVHSFPGASSSWTNLVGLAYAANTGYIYLRTQSWTAPGGMMEAHWETWYGWLYLSGLNNVPFSGPFLINPNIAQVSKGWLEVGDTLWWAIDYVGSNNFTRLRYRTRETVYTPNGNGGFAPAQAWRADDSYVYCLGATDFHDPIPGVHLYRYNPATVAFDRLSDPPGEWEGLPVGMNGGGYSVLGGRIAWGWGPTGLEIWRGYNQNRIQAINSPSAVDYHTPTRDSTGLIYVFSGNLNSGTIKHNSATTLAQGPEDVNFADMAKDVILAPYAAGLADIIGPSEFAAVRAFCETNDLRGAGNFETAQSALRVIEEILSHYFGWLGYVQGKLVFGAKRQETATREIVRSDALKDGAGEFSVGTLRDTRNRVVIDWTNRANHYNEEPHELSDDDDRARTWDRTEHLRLRLITRPVLVAKHTAKALYFLSRPQFGYSVLMGPKELVLAPGDVVALTDEAEGLSQAPVRIMAISESEDRGQFRVEVVEEPTAILQLSQFPVQPTNPGDPGPSPSGDPGLTSPQILELPGELSGESLRLAFVLAGSTPEWSGAGIYMSLDGTSYTRLQTYSGPSAITGWVTGKAVPALAETHYHDLRHIDVDFGLSGLQPQAVPRNAMLAGANLALVGGDLLSFRDAALISGSQYRLKGLLRGWHDVGPVMVPVAAPVAIIRPDVATLVFPEAQIGQTVFFKFASINQAGVEQSIAGLPSYSVTLTGRGREPDPVAGLQVVQGGTRQGSKRVIGTGQIDVVIGWLYRRPGNLENADLVDGAEVQGKEPDFKDYIVRVYSKALVGDPWVLRRTVEALTSETYTYTAAANIADGGTYKPFLRFEAETRRLTGAVSPMQVLEVQVVQ